ncbi:ABC transporter permease [Roseomonas sp. AR75]|jgi:ABC-type spermidine/putrescine transport system permease subunit I|uniref:ABC transporter permease n=1 Tax=Roseomonas sp. AR75 TaxID=2562311 RepID=UPI0010BFBEDD|nr:ABC transporter permease [Roseomonas sp. AR75]
MTRLVLSALGSGTREGGVLRWLLPLLPVLVLLLIFFLLPLGELLRMSLLATRPMPRTPDPDVTLANYVAVFADPLHAEMAVNSLLVGLATVIFTLLIAYPVAIYLTRCGSWERTFISVACLLPIFVNLIVGILGWYILLLPFGVLQQALQWAGLIDGPLRLLRSFPALVLVLTYEHLPFAVLILASAVQNVPQDRINAARLLGASNLRIFRTVMLPLTMPGIVASAILVFSLSVSSYLIPILIGAQRVPVIPMAIFSYGTEQMNWPMGAALAFVLLVSVALITYGFTVLAGRLTRRGQWEVT